MRQTPFTAPQLKKLLANAEHGNRTGETNPPVVKYFTPWTDCTWLICEAEKHEDTGDYTLFGLCDLGHGSPEIGSVLLSELKSLRGPMGLTVERDRYFTADKSLNEYAEAAREARYISA